MVIDTGKHRSVIEIRRGKCGDVAGSIALKTLPIELAIIPEPHNCAAVVDAGCHGEVRACDGEIGDGAGRISQETLSVQTGVPELPNDLTGRVDRRDMETGRAPDDRIEVNEMAGFVANEGADSACALVIVVTGNLAAVVYGTCKCAFSIR